MKRFVGASIVLAFAQHLFAPHAEELPFLNSIKGRERATSGQFISCDNFRSIADHILDEDSPSIATEQVNTGDVVYVHSRYMEDFFNDYHPHIKNRYILITGNADRSITSGFTVNQKCYQTDCGVQRYLEDQSLAMWFAQNLVSRHPKLVHIPIGIQSVRWGRDFVGTINSLNKAAESRNKKYLLSGNFQQKTNLAVRKPLYESFKDKPFCYMPKAKKLADYLLDVAHSKFILSPPGNGLDCYRTWEALYLGTYPIVLSSPIDPVYENLPVLIVQRWEDITAEFLNEKYEEMRNKEYQLEKLNFDYWQNLIRNAQQHIRNMADQAGL